MSLFRGTIRSELLQLDTGLTVILPYDYPTTVRQEPCPVVYVLHGLGGNHECWTRYSNIERYARQYGAAIVMPDVWRSFCSNMQYGRPMFDYITQELPSVIGAMFRISQKREDTFIAGQSMGGYGCLKCAFTCPEQYAAAGAISGVADFKLRFPVDFEDTVRAPDMQHIFGKEPVMEPNDDLFVLAERVAQLPEAARPRIYACCGEQDPLREYNLNLTTHMKTLPLEYTYQEWEGVHTWPFFDEAMKRVLAFFFENR